MNSTAWEKFSNVALLLGDSVQKIFLSNPMICFNAYHGEIDVGGIEFHVDLLVDQRLAVLVVVLPDLGHGHLDRLVGLGVGEVEERKSLKFVARRSLVPTLGVA